MSYKMTSSLTKQRFAVLAENFLCFRVVRELLVQLGRLLCEVHETVAEEPLRLHDAVEVVGERLRELEDVLVLALRLAQTFDLRFELDVDRALTLAEALRDELLGALELVERPVLDVLQLHLHGRLHARRL